MTMPRDEEEDGPRGGPFDPSRRATGQRGPARNRQLNTITGLFHNPIEGAYVTARGIDEGVGSLPLGLTAEGQVGLLEDHLITRPIEGARGLPQYYERFERGIERGALREALRESPEFLYDTLVAARSKLTGNVAAPFVQSSRELGEIIANWDDLSREERFEEISNTIIPNNLFLSSIVEHELAKETYIPGYEVSKLWPTLSPDERAFFIGVDVVFAVSPVAAIRAARAAPGSLIDIGRRAAGGPLPLGYERALIRQGAYDQVARIRQARAAGRLTETYTREQLYNLFGPGRRFRQDPSRVGPPGLNPAFEVTGIPSRSGPTPADVEFRQNVQQGIDFEGDVASQSVFDTLASRNFQILGAAASPLAAFSPGLDLARGLDFDVNRPAETRSTEFFLQREASQPPPSPEFQRTQQELAIAQQIESQVEADVRAAQFGFTRGEDGIFQRFDVAAQDEDTDQDQDQDEDTDQDQDQDEDTDQDQDPDEIPVETERFIEDPDTETQTDEDTDQDEDIPPGDVPPDEDPRTPRRVPPIDLPTSADAAGVGRQFRETIRVNTGLSSHYIYLPTGRELYSEPSRRAAGSIDVITTGERRPLDARIEVGDNILLYVSNLGQTIQVTPLQAARLREDVFRPRRMSRGRV